MLNNKDIFLFIPTNNPMKLMDFNSFERLVGEVYLDNINLGEMLLEKRLVIRYEKEKKKQITTGKFPQEFNCLLCKR